eukprot:43011-Prymnesium_polylepis.1
MASPTINAQQEGRGAQTAGRARPRPSAMLGAEPTSCSSTPAYFLTMVTLGIGANQRCRYPAWSGMCSPHA